MQTIIRLPPDNMSFFFFSFFPPSHSLSSPFCSLSLLVVNQTRGHIAGSYPPLPTTVHALHFLSREDFSSFFPRRLASNCAYPRQALSAVDPFLFMQIKSKFHHGGIRTHGPTLLVAFEGYHQSTGARPYKPAPKEGHEVRIGDLSDAWNGQNSTISRKVHLTVQPVCPSYLMVIDKRRLRLPPPPLSTNSLFFYLLLI